MERERILSFFDELAPYYDEFSLKREAYLSAVDRIIIEKMTDTGSKRMLDIGSGTGTRALKIARGAKVRHLTMVEPSEKMFEICSSISGDGMLEIRSVRIRSEDLDEIMDDLGKFDSVTCLWNVMGHIVDSRMRVMSLRNLHSFIEEGGRMFIDVNNRYNTRAYGYRTVLFNIVRDILSPGEGNGDVNYLVEIAGRTVSANGHLFSPSEMRGLFLKAGIRRFRRIHVNYETGKIMKSPLHGQLLYIIKKEHGGVEIT